jgi:thioredoxin 1
MLKEITDEEFVAEVEQDSGVVLVDFWAPWCGPCRMMAPVYEKMAEKYPKIKFCKVNTTENIEKAGEYGVTGIPCIIVFKEGKELDRLVGFRPEAAFEEELKKYA